MIQLQSDRLAVHILEPGEGTNKTLRFSRAGFVSEVILDGRTYFCASEPNCLWHACTGGRGLCSEILFDASHEVRVGGWFPKFSVGHLQKFEEDQYWCYKKYLCRDAEVRCEVFPTPDGGQAVAFTAVTEACLGYALEEKRTVTLSGNTLRFDITLKNTGSRGVTLREYCHNFLSIGGMAIGPSYTLELPDLCVPQGVVPSYEGIDNLEGIPGALRIMGHSEKEYAIVSFPPSALRGDGSFRWKLCNSSEGAYVECTEAFSPAEVKVWCVDHMISPEVFREVSLLPGASDSWSRTYCFGRIG